MRWQQDHGRTTFSADLGSGVVVVRNVRATVCAQCGEEWIDTDTAHQLEEIVNDARKKRLLVEVTSARLTFYAFLRSILPNHPRYPRPPPDGLAVASNPRFNSSRW